MPLPQRYDYQGAGHAFNQVGNTLSELAVQMAQQRMQEEYRRQLMQYHMAEAETRAKQQKALEKHYDTQNALARAQEALATQKAGEITDQRQSAGVLGDVVAHMGDPNMGPMTQNLLQSIAMDKAARIAGTHPANIMEQLAQASEMATNPRMRQLIATGTKATEVVPNQAAAIDTVTGKPTFQSPYKLNQGQTMVPATGGAAIATGLPPKAPLSEAARIFGSIGNIYRGSRPGELEEPSETHLAAEKAVNEMLPFMVQKAMTGGQMNVAIRTITTRAEFDSLNSGDMYINAKDGRKYTKP